MTDSKKANEQIISPMNAPHILVNPGKTPGSYIAYFDEFIDFPIQYRELTQLLAVSDQSVTIELYLNGPGGYMCACVQLIHAIANTEARVIGHLIGESHSAHANIFMACHSHVVYPYSFMMVHTFSGGFGGKGKDSLRASQAYNGMVTELYTDLYTGFLSEEELVDVLDHNKDLHFYGEDIATRLTAVYEARDAEAARIEDAEQKAELDNLRAIIAEADEKEASLEEENEQVFEDEQE